MNRLLYSVVSCGSLFSDSAYKTEQIIFVIMEEIWKVHPIFGWKYEVSSIWNIRHIKNKKNLAKHITYWYCYPTMSNENWVPRCKRLHRLIAEAFIPNPDNKPYINHINWIKHDNRVENLEWVTWSENNIHAFRISWWTTTNKKKPIEQYTKEMVYIAEFESVASAWRILWIWHQQISNNLVWKQPHCHGFIFKYKNY